MFDFADINQPIPQRTTSTVATQALFVLNSEFVIEQARHAADRLLKSDTPDSERIALAFQWSLGRAPNDAEIRTAQEFIEGGISGNDTAEDRRDVWAGLLQSLWATPEFRFLK